MAHTFAEAHLSHLFDEYGAWFGPPAILTVPRRHVAAIVQSRGLFIDGWQRFEVLMHRPDFQRIWLAAPVVTFTEPYSNDHRLVRALALAGHYGRAWDRLPDAFRGCVADIKAFTGLSTLECSAIMAARKQSREARDKRRHFQHRDNERIVVQIRQLFAAHDEAGAALSLDEIRRIIL
jgi:hypothetical protein